MSKIKISKVTTRSFDCVYCEEQNIYPPKNMDLREEKFYRIKCPKCGKTNYVLPVIQIEPFPYTYEDYKDMKDDKEKILRSIYTSY